MTTRALSFAELDGGAGHRAVELGGMMPAAGPGAKRGGGGW
jgi:hypothetical protein